MKKWIRKHKIFATAMLFVLLILLCAVITISCELSDVEKQQGYLYRILSNPYVSGVIYTVGLLYIVYAFQITVSKRRIKHDFRCNEVMEDIDDSIVELYEIIDTKNDNETYKNFILRNRAKLFFVKLGLTYYNNSILLESLNVCFFFNLNFELLGIINNIKNRLPNIICGI